jgi:hypothetical protein
MSVGRETCCAGVWPRVGFALASLEQSSSAPEYEGPTMKIRQARESRGIGGGGAEAMVW